MARLLPQERFLSLSFFKLKKNFFPSNMFAFHKSWLKQQGTGINSFAKLCTRIKRKKTFRKSNINMRIRHFDRNSKEEVLRKLRDLLSRWKKNCFLIYWCSPAQDISIAMLDVSTLHKLRKKTFSVSNKSSFFSSAVVWVWLFRISLPVSLTHQ